MRKLIHPIYLDVSMLVAFAGTLAGGLALESEVTHVVSDQAKKRRDSALSVGLSGLLSGFASVTGGLSGSSEASNEAQATRRELRKHTEAQLAIELYNDLSGINGAITTPTDIDDLQSLECGALVQLTGIAEKNPVDEVIDVLHALSILVRLSPDEDCAKKGRPLPAPTAVADRLRSALDEDRRRTPFSNLILQCEEPEGVTVAVSLKRENLRELTMSELQHNRVNVLGKVLRFVPSGAEMSAFGNYGMSLMTREVQEETFDKARKSGLATSIRSPFLQGPAIQLLPLMVFV